MRSGLWSRALVQVLPERPPCCPLPLRSPALPSPGLRASLLQCSLTLLWDLLSAGIGKAIAFKLAKQGLNVVLVALGDNLLDTTFAEIQEQFPALQFRKVTQTLSARCQMSRQPWRTVKETQAGSGRPAAAEYGSASCA